MDLLLRFGLTVSSNFFVLHNFAWVNPQPKGYSTYRFEYNRSVFCDRKLCLMASLPAMTKAVQSWVQKPHVGVMFFFT